MLVLVWSKARGHGQSLQAAAGVEEEGMEAWMEGGGGGAVVAEQSELPLLLFFNCKSVLDSESSCQKEEWEGRKGERDDRVMISLWR